MVRLSFTARAGKQFVPFVRKHLRRAHLLLGSGVSELSVALVGDATMGRLHERFMGVSGPTDVLTFPLEMGRRGRAVAGEAVICVGEARRNARRYGIPVRNEVLLYALHALLHLEGMDDRTEAGFRKMHRMEDRLLTELGIGPTFAPPGQGGARPKGKR
jgi:probable rRNA maturation factor